MSCSYTLHMIGSGATESSHRQSTHPSPLPFGCPPRKSTALHRRRHAATPTPPPPPIPEIRCGQSVSANIAGNNDFSPFMLDLRAASGNTRLLLSTCSSPVNDPDLCLFREYIDDDQSESAEIHRSEHACPNCHDRTAFCTTHTGSTHSEF